MRKSGFTLRIVPHSGRPGRSYDIAGAKLHIFRMGTGLLVLLLIAAVVLVAIGIGEEGRIRALQTENAALRESLATFEGIDARLDRIGRDIERIREVRRRIENLAGVAESTASDSL